METRLYTDLLETPMGEMITTVSDAGLVYFGYQDQEKTSRRLNKTGIREERAQSHPLFRQLSLQLEQWFSGDRQTFSIPLVLRGTAFQEKVWNQLQKIPYGHTLSYQALAERVGNRKAVRAVASANRVNPISILVPCHRVIGKDGSLTGYAGGLGRKKKLLEHEQNVTKVDLFAS